MKRKEFLKRLGMGAAMIPIVACSASDSDEILSNTEDTSEDVSSPDCSLTNSETEGPFPIKDPSSLEGTT